MIAIKILISNGIAEMPNNVHANTFTEHLGTMQARNRLDLAQAKDYACQLRLHFTEAINALGV